MDIFYNDVNEWLSVGADLDMARGLTGLPHTLTVDALRDRGVTHVLDLRSEWEDQDAWTRRGLAAENYCHAPITDSNRHIPAESWYTTVEEFVERFWLDPEGNRLYVHCHMGINRAPSAAMLALLTVNENLSPFEAFLAIREARPAAGLVYAEHVGVRHLLNAEGMTEFTEDDTLPQSVVEFGAMLDAYWTPELVRSVNKGISYFRTKEGGTRVEGSTIADRLDRYANLG